METLRWRDSRSRGRSETAPDPDSVAPSAIRRRRLDVAILLAYLALTLLLTYPLAARMGTAVKDLGDPLTNSWILSWNAKQMAAGNLAGFFDANIFYPHPRSLAMSEFLIPQSIIAAPVFFISGNPVLAYNFVYVLAITTTAFATFLLGRLLTGSTLAGFVAGVAFAFNPYFGTHLSHLQVLTAAGIPLAFFFLHKYFESGSPRDLMLFSLSFVTQALANGYYAVFLTYFAGLFIVDQAFRRRWLHKPRFWGHMVLHALLSLGALAPFFYQYVALRRQIGGSSVIAYRGTAWSFVSASAFNRLYGNLTSSLSGPEWRLFSGWLVVALAALGVLAALHRTRPQADLEPGRSEGIAARLGGAVYRASGWTIVAGVFGVALISATGGVDSTILSIPISVVDIGRPMVAVAVAVLVRMFLVAVFGQRVRVGAVALREPQRAYIWVLTFAVILTLGPDGLYRIAYDYVPGVDALRGPGRIHVMSVFCLAILAAFGFRELSSRLGGRKRFLAAALVLALMCLEQLAVPVPLAVVPVKEEIPPAYRWLARQEGGFAIAEYPMGRRADQSRVYYSIYHSKMLLNGYRSGSVPLYREMRWRAEEFPNEQSVVDLESLGIRFLVVDRGRYGWQWPGIEHGLESLRERFPGRLRLANDAGDQVVYELTQRQLRSRESFWNRPAPVGVRLDRGNWRAFSEPHQEIAGRALDGDISTRWHSLQQARGDSFELDLGETAEFDRVVIDIGDRARDYPRGYRLEVSTDRRTWVSLSVDPVYSLPITEYLRPARLRMEIDVPGGVGRYVRMIQTGEDPGYDWSIFEFNLFRRR